MPSDVKTGRIKVDDRIDKKKISKKKTGLFSRKSLDTIKLDGKSIKVAKKYLRVKTQKTSNVGKIRREKKWKKRVTGQKFKESKKKKRRQQREEKKKKEKKTSNANPNPNPNL